MKSTNSNNNQPDPSLRYAIEAEALSISKESGLDAQRVFKVLEALLLDSTTDNPETTKLGEDGTTISFHIGELREAIKQMGPENALRYLEEEDVAVVRRRCSTYESLSREWQPLYSIAELGKLAGATRQHLGVNLDRLIRFGFCKLDYLKQGVIFLPLSTLLFRNPIRATQDAKNPRGAESGTSSQCDVDSVSTEELMGVRRRLYSIQDKVLGLIERACVENWSRDVLRTCAVELFRNDISEDDISQCLSLEVGEETVSNPARGLIDSDIPFGGSFLGGLTTVLRVLCHTELELEYHLYHSAYHSLQGFIMTDTASILRKLRTGYFIRLGRPEGRRLNEALDTFARTKCLAEAFEKEFYEAYSMALLEEHYVPCGDDMLPKADEKKIREKIRDFRDFLLRWYRINGRFPSELRVSIMDDGERQAGEQSMVFEDGHWSICFRGRKIVMRDMLGLHYIAAILRTHPIPIELPALDDLLDSRSAIVAKHISRMPCKPMITREVSDQENLNTWAFQALPATDEKALADVRRRLDKLSSLIRDERDSGKKEEYQREIEWCSKYLMENGYSNRYGNPASKVTRDPQIEKLRHKVYMAVKRALESLSKTDPELANELAAIIIGRNCYYKAPPDMRWTN